MKKNNIRYLKEYEVTKAADDLEPTLAIIYDKYGREITLLTLQYLTAKAIVFGEDLTKQELKDTVKDIGTNLSRFVQFMSNLLSNGSEDS